MHYRTILPNPQLAKHVECFWLLESRGQPREVAPERIMPDGCIELIFNLADPFKRYHANGVIETQPQTLVAGQMRSYALIEPTGRVKLFGVRFHPGGAFPFLRFPVCELTDSIINFENVLSRLGKELAEKVQRARSSRERIAVIEAAFLARLTQFEAADQLIDTVVNLMVRRNGLISIERLQQHSNLSGRQLERRFQSQVGLTPKFFCRILRFQKVFKAAAQPQKVNWSCIAAECGYYDQAHFIHDFKAFSGQNPSAYFSEDHALSEYFTRKHRLSDFYNTNE